MYVLQKSEICCATVLLSVAENGVCWGQALCDLKKHLEKGLRHRVCFVLQIII